MAGQPAPADIKMSLTPFFMKSQEQRTFVPFVLDVKDAPTDRRRHVRARGQSGRHARPEGQEGRVPVGRHPLRPGRRSSGDSGKLNRVFMAAPGTYDVYLAIKERLPEKAPKTPGRQDGRAQDADHRARLLERRARRPARMLVADKVNMLTAPLSPDEARERPFVFGAQELIPAAGHGIQKSEELSIFFQVYNAGLDPAGKPNIAIEYEFHKKEGERREVLQQDQPADRQRREPAAPVRSGEVPGPGRHFGAAAELRRRQLSPGHQDQRQGVGQGLDTRRELYGQSVVNCR